MLIFNTEKEAENGLQRYFFRNSDLLAGIDQQIEARVRVYEKTPEFARLRQENKSLELNAKEKRLIFSNLGRGETLTTLFRMYVVEKEYRFDAGFTLTDKQLYHRGPLPSIEDLIGEVHKFRKTQETSILQLNLAFKITPLFFTVREPYFFTNKQKEDLQIEQNFGRGITSEEAKEFEKNYGAKLPN